MKTAAILVLVLVAALLAAPVCADEPSPGPLDVKAYMPWAVPQPRDPESCVQRVYVRLANPAAQAAEVVKLEGAFMDADGQVLFTDTPPPPTVPAGETRELYLRFNNSAMRGYVACRVTIGYRLGSQTCERRVRLTPEQPGFPEGYVPGQP